MRTNRAPFTDECFFIVSTEALDAGGYATVTETQRPILSSFSEGVARTEFYEAQKAGYKLSATVEVVESNYNNEPNVLHAGRRYKVVRTFPSGYGTLLLYLEEVIR